MSAGAFSISRYERDNGDIHPIRIQPETASLEIAAGSNTPPASTTFDSDISANTSRGNRGVGLKPRTVTFRFTGGAPTGYLANGTITLPVLTPTFWATIVKGQTGNYLGGTIVVSYKSPERVG